MDELCLDALARGLGGLEDFAGMPGSVGGAVFMNARCYEREVSQVLAWALSARDRRRRIATPDRRAAEWSYKRSPYQPGGTGAGELILEAAFRLTPARRSGRGPRRARHARAAGRPRGQGPLPPALGRARSSRTTEAFGAPTGKLLDGLGLRGRRIGDAMVSPWHANIFVNSGHATAADMRALIELTRREARERLGVELEPEVLMIGEF